MVEEAIHQKEITHLVEEAIHPEEITQLVEVTILVGLIHQTIVVTRQTKVVTLVTMSSNNSNIH